MREKKREKGDEGKKDENEWGNGEKRGDKRVMAERI